MDFRILKNSFNDDMITARFKFDGTVIDEEFWWFNEKDEYKELVDLAVTILGECWRNVKDDGELYIKSQLSELIGDV